MNVLKNDNKPKHNISIKSNYTVLSDEFKLYLQNCHFTIIKDKLIYWMNYRKMWEKSLFKNAIFNISTKVRVKYVYSKCVH